MKTKQFEVKFRIRFLNKRGAVLEDKITFTLTDEKEFDSFVRKMNECVEKDLTHTIKTENGNEINLKIEDFFIDKFLNILVYSKCNL